MLYKAGRPAGPVLALFVLAGAAAAQDGFQEIQSRVTSFTLKNGMTFIVLERHQAPVASFMTYADVGSAQETVGITGLAHIFEHIAFKGTPTLGGNNYAEEKLALDHVDRTFEAFRAERSKGAKADPQKLKALEADFKAAQDGAGKFVVKNEFGEVIERAGGRGLNANTSWDATHYYFSLPSNSEELWFFLESERFLHPVLREFYKEKDVVMEERRMSLESQPVGKLVDEALHVSYKAHPYGVHVIGHMSDLENITRGDAEAFFKKYYIPSNLVGVVVGDVDAKRTRALAETYFGRIPSGPKPEPLHTVEPPQDAERRVTLHLQAQRLVLMAYHKPDINDPDNAVYEALSSILSDGRSSRLYRSLVRDKKVATAAFGFPGFPGQKYPGLFIFAAFTAPDHTNAEVEKVFDEEIQRVKDAPVSAEELQGVKRRSRANLVRGLDDNARIAYQLADWQVLTGDWRNLFKHLNQIAAVTPQDIERVAKATFTDNNRNVATIEPAEAAPAK